MEIVKAGFNLPALQAEQIRLSLTESSRRFASISKSIVKQGNL